MVINHLDSLIQDVESRVRRYLILLTDEHGVRVVPRQRTANDWQVEVVEQSIASLSLRCLVFDFKDLLGVLQDVFNVFNIVQHFVKFRCLLEVLRARIHVEILVLLDGQRREEVHQDVLVFAAVYVAFHLVRTHRIQRVAHSGLILLVRRSRLIELATRRLPVRIRGRG